MIPVFKDIIFNMKPVGVLAFVSFLSHKSDNVRGYECT